jgi:hypothetical protein
MRKRTKKCLFSRDSSPRKQGFAGLAKQRKEHNTMKKIAFMTLVAVAFGLGACAKDHSHSSQPVASKNVKGFKK